MDKPRRLDAAAAQDLRFVEGFLVWRARAWSGLFGATRRPDPLRDSLLRRIALLHSEGKSERLAYYQREFASLGSRSAVLIQLRDLESYGLITLSSEGVAPTGKLMDWFVGYMAAIKKMMADYPVALRVQDQDETSNQKAPVNF